MVQKKAEKKVEDIYPLSPMQQGMLFYALLEPDSPIYSERFTYTIEGDLNVDAFLKAWQHLGNVHPLFRTVFRWEGVNEPVQIVLKDRTPEIELHDFSKMSGEEEKQNIKNFLSTESKRRFDLANGPLVRLHLFILKNQRFFFSWSFHHILTDGWCIPLILSDLFVTYLSILENKPLPSIKRPQYRNYIAWLKKQDKTKAEKYWKKILGSFEAPTPLPQDFHPKERGISNVGKKSLILDEKLTAALNETARKQRITLSTLVQTAWSILLGRYSRQEDVVFGVTLSGRPADLPGSDEMIGLFINTLPVRANFENGITIEELMTDLQSQALKIEEFGYSFLPEVKACSAVPGKANLFNNLFIFENYPVNMGEMTGDSTIRITDSTIEEMTHYDLTLVITPGKKLDINLGYALDLFAPETIDRMLSHLKIILEQITIDIKQPASTVDIMSPQEKEMVLFGFNSTASEYSRDATIVDVFEARVQKNPDRTAVVFRENSLSFEELNIRANKLARALISNGVKPGALVGMMVGDPLETILSILGILKAGGAYMPIDPDFPEARIDFMLDDSCTPVVISREEFADKVPLSQKVLYLDRDWHEIEKQDPSNPGIKISAEDIAYSIYTSGSTGKPKGTLVPHRGVINLVHGLVKILYSYYEGHLRVAQLASFSFDASVQQIFASLLLGHTLYPIPGSIKKDLGQLIPYILKNEIEVIDGTPSLWELLVGSGIMDEPELKLRHVIIGGEALPVDLVRRYHDGVYGKSTRWTNVYGVTESSVDSTSYLVDIDALKNRISVPIGAPIVNTWIYILDGNRNPVPVGVPGELYIGGDGLAKGYLNNPERTEQNFVPDPFRDGELMYRTGDLGKWLPDGNIDFLGRIDFQIKIRGFRIELGEIESAMSSYPGIEDCVVVDRIDAAGDRYLIGFYVASNEISIPDLRNSLAGALPDYMVPGRFMRLDALPLNTSGKVDRNSLPEPEDSFNASETEYVAPRNDTEKALALIWQDVLAIDKVGVKDNFFDIGGHSLKATKVVSRIKKDMNIELPLRAIFEDPTIEGLGRAISSMQGQKLGEIPKLPHKDAYELSHAQKRLWFLEQMTPGSSTYNIPMALMIEGEIQTDLMEKALNNVALRHETLRTSFSSVDGEPVQIIEPSIHVDLNLTDMTDKTEEQISQTVINEISGSFDLAVTPLFRACLYKLGENKHLFVFTIHHIISDGWSTEVLLKELIGTYMSLMTETKAALPDLKVQYKDYASWQNRLIEEGMLKGQEEYWVKKLAAPLPVLDLPTDRPRPPLQTYNGAVYKFEFDGDVAKQLNSFAKKQGATMFMTILSAFAVLINRLSNQEDIIIGTPIAGRNHPDLEPLIGFFVNTLALRVDVSDNPSFTELVKRVKSVCIEAYANQDYPFDGLIDVLNPVRDVSRNAIFGVMYIHQNMTDLFSMKTGLSIKPVEADLTTTKFDLTFSSVEIGERLLGYLEYNTDLFDRTTIEGFAGFIKNILAEASVKPETRVFAFDVLGEEERHKLLVEFNDTDKPYDLSRCTYQMFEEQAAKTPDRIAVTAYDGRKLTYRELNERMNQLARRLRKLGVGAETMVAVMLERSIEMEVALLGINKAGGAYVPMGTDYPEARVDYILKDTNAPVVLVQEKYASKFEGKNIIVISLDSGWDDISSEDTSNPEPVSGPENLAYVLYTSGSTGVPKGVACIHIGLTNRLIWMQEAYGLKEDDCILQKTPYTFDVSGWEFHWPMMYGARLHFLMPDGQKDPSHIMEVINEQKVTTLHFVPSMLGGFLQVVDDSNKASLASLRRVICSGEALLAEHRDTFFRYIDCELHNLYGPTEASIDVTYYELSPDDKSNIVPIGKPLANTRIYILNKHMQLVPVGVPGQIFLAGVQLARGYVNQPEKTADAFIDFNISRDNRLYKTGDLGAWMHDGNIEYLGRIDHQVKIRGNRVELGEVESALCRFSGVRECVVVDKTDPSGSKYLVGYYASDNELPVDELRRFLHDFLPEYMIPTRFICMPGLPLNANGKVDRKQLPEIESVRPEMANEYVAPSTDVEKLLAQVWKEVLGVERVGINDNFFDLGGHSLLIMKVIAKVKMSLPLTVQDFFDNQTISGLAKCVEEKALAARKTSSQKELIEEKFDGFKVDIPVSGKTEEMKSILMTGASGYLGSHLLRDLLNDTDADIICLLPGKDVDDARKMLFEAIDFYFRDEGLDASRLKIFASDIGIDGLGLDGDALELIKNTDTVIHVAADVRHFGDYKHFRNINVLGTKRVLSLAETGKAKRFHHVSTLSVAGDFVPGFSKVVFKETDYDRGQELGNVYAKSKFEAEGVVREAMARGVKCTIYRIGNLVGESRSGLFQKNIDGSSFYGLLKSIIETGVIPDGDGGMFDFTPVDCCSKAIATLARIPETSGRCLHLFNPDLISLKGLVEIMNSNGYPIRIVNVEEYALALGTAQAEKGSKAIEGLLPYLEAKSVTQYVLDNSYSRHFLDGLGFSWPEVDEAFIGKLLGYCAKVGFIGKPQVGK
jgi:amino acid adenylation domain-containing protein/thioester reductase-like protein